MFKFNAYNAVILVIGDVMIDHYIYGDCNRISPEAPVQVVDIKSEEFTLGGAGNVIKNLHAFGASSKLIAVTGDDAPSRITESELNNLNISTDCIIKDKSRCTTVKSRVLASNHQLIRLDKEDTFPIRPDVEGQVISMLGQELKSVNAVLLSDYNKGLLTPTLLKEVFRLCREAGIPTLVDPKGTDFSKYLGAYLIKPNRKEAGLAAGIRINDNDTLLEACTRIREQTKAENIVVTLSEDGIALFAEDKLQIIPTKAMSVVDVTGAGDTVLAALGIAVASGYDLKTACDFANHAAAVVVSKVGSATVTLNEISELG